MGCAKSKPKLLRSHIPRPGPEQQALVEQSGDADGGNGDGGNEDMVMSSIADESIPRKLTEVIASAAASVADAGHAIGLIKRPSPSGIEVTGLLTELNSDRPFHENRWECVWRPEQAACTLGPHAHLELEILQGSQVLLQYGEDGLRQSLLDVIGDEDMFVRVFKDDRWVFDTDCVSRSSRPSWESKHNIGITVPRSMIRLQIFYGHANAVSPQIAGAASTPTCALGFVEFCVGDIPFAEDPSDQGLQCWLELRFPEMLQGSSLQRYEQHCLERDDARNRELTKDGRDRVDMGLMGTAHTRHRKSGWLGQLCAAVQGVSGALQGYTRTEGEYQFNAGELLVRLRLSRAPDASWQDKYFALALDAQAADFEFLVQQEHLPKLDLQELVDDTLDVKLALLDDFMLSFALYVWYIISWQHMAISLMCTLCMLCYFTEYPDEESTYVAAFGMSLLLLLVNAFEDQRLNMTTGGVNAMLTEDGFRRVAKWGDSSQMHMFILRCVTSRGGTVRSEHDLRQFVVRVAKDGSRWKLSTVLEALHYQDWCTLPLEELKEGQLVRLHGRQRATVVKIGTSAEDMMENGAASTTVEAADEQQKRGSDMVEVQLDVEDDEDGVQNLTKWVPSSAVETRIEVPPIGHNLLTHGLLHGVGVKTIISAWSFRVSAMKAALLPILEMIGDVVTWKSRSHTMAVVFYLFARLVLSLVHWVKPPERRLMYELEEVIRIFTGGTVFAVVFVVVNVEKGARLTWARSFARIVVRALSMKSSRTAPEKWKFQHPKPPEERLRSTAPSGFS